MYTFCQLPAKSSKLEYGHRMVVYRFDCITSPLALAARTGECDDSDEVDTPLWKCTGSSVRLHVMFCSL